MINPSQVPNWIVIIYERQQRFNDQVANQMAADLVRACEAVGAASNRGVVDITQRDFYRDKHEPSTVSYKMGIGTRDYSSSLLSHFRFL
jgi:hypothetical protein